MSDQTPKKVLTCDSSSETPCPLCFKHFSVSQIEVHVNKCLFLTSSNENQGSSSQTNHPMKRVSEDFKLSSTPKKAKEDQNINSFERRSTSDHMIKIRQVSFST